MLLCVFGASGAGCAGILLAELSHSAPPRQAQCQAATASSPPPGPITKEVVQQNTAPPQSGSSAYHRRSSPARRLKSHAGLQGRAYCNRADLRPKPFATATIAASTERGAETSGRILTHNTANVTSCAEPFLRNNRRSPPSLVFIRCPNRLCIPGCYGVADIAWIVPLPRTQGLMQPSDESALQRERPIARTFRSDQQLSAFNPITR